MRWIDVDLKNKKGELRVRQRADRRNKIGSPKSARGQRTVPLPPTVVSELRQWKLKCPKHDGKLVPARRLDPQHRGGRVEPDVRIRIARRLPQDRQGGSRRRSQ